MSQKSEKDLQALATAGDEGLVFDDALLESGFKNMGSPKPFRPIELTVQVSVD